MLYCELITCPVLPQQVNNWESRLLFEVAADLRIFLPTL